MGIYSEELAKINPQWKRELFTIPAAKDIDAPERLRERIYHLWDGLGRGAPIALEDWSLSRLYAEFFERSAEFMLSSYHPGIYSDCLRRVTNNERVIKKRNSGSLFG